MNRGLELASGDILGFLNADDYYEPGVLAEAENVLKEMVRPSMVFGNCNVL